MEYPIDLSVTGTINIHAGGMKDMVSIAVTGSNSCVFQDMIPGFVVVNNHFMDNIGQANIRGSLEQAGSALFMPQLTQPMALPMGISMALVGPALVPAILPAPVISAPGIIPQISVLPLTGPKPTFEGSTLQDLLPKPLPEFNGASSKDILTTAELNSLILGEVTSPAKVKVMFPGGGNLAASYSTNEYFEVEKPEWLFLGATGSSSLTKPVTFESFNHIQPAVYLPVPVTAKAFAGASALIVQPKPLHEFSGVIPSVALERPLLLELPADAIKTRVMFPGGGNIVPSYSVGLPLGAEKPLWEPKIRKEERKR
jgi:hypothetical protein